MGINEIRALKAAKTGTKMTAAEFQKTFTKVKVGGNTMEGKFHSGKYECSKGNVYFRSKWEANYALYLDWLVKNGKIKDWQYEADIFFFEGIKMGTNSYRPDFKIFNLDGSFHYDEIKGYLDAKSKTRLKRMKKYHPNVKVILIERKAYDGIIRSMKGIIKFY